jgi:hypothetical protein
MSEPAAGDGMSIGTSTGTGTSLRPAILDQPLKVSEVHVAAGKLQSV